MNSQNIIIGPLITEKAMDQAQKGKFSFAVTKHATKTMIKKIINDTFKVNCVSIQTAIGKGKTKRAGMKRTEIAQSEWKKAIVTLRKGEKIDIFGATGENTNNK